MGVRVGGGAVIGGGRGRIGAGRKKTWGREEKRR